MKKYQQPDIKGYFGIYGGKFVPETLIKPLQELEKVYSMISVDKKFIKELKQLNAEFTGRPTPLTFAERLTAHFNSAKIFLKREDLCHTGAHKINNALGQILLAKKMGKKRIIAETGAGQHGVAVASVCAKFGFECSIYMGAKDMIRQSLNVFRMKVFGAKVVEVNSGSKTLKDATNEALRDWVTNVYDTHYIIGSVAGPHPYPMMVRDFQSIIGTELKSQFHKIFKKKPDYILACVGGGSNAIGIFYPFINDESTKLIGVEAAGLGLNTGKHSATLTRGSAGVFHGMMSYLLQDQNGQVKETHSISAGLNYPGIGPEHSYLKDKKRVEYFSVTDSEALEGAKILTQLEGILPALETAHAIGYLPRLMRKTKADQTVVVNISGRGDKDISTLMKEFL